ncbi:MAG: oligosaccharide flippase family protein [bacterium]|nr:oligosaccharide flippase family protein [bacterium]
MTGASGSDPSTVATSASRLVGGSAFLFACRFTGAVATFVVQVLLARWMGSEELGVYVLAFSWTALLATVACSGYPPAAMRFVAQGLAADERGSVAGFVTHAARNVLAASALIVLIGLALVFGSGWIESEHIAVFAAAMVAVPFLALTNLQGGIANGFAWFALAFVPQNVARPLVFLGGVSVVWYSGSTLNAGVAMGLHAAVMLAVVLALFTRLRPRLTRTLGDATPVRTARLWRRTATPLLVLSLFSTYFPEVTVIVLGTLLPKEEIAIYNAGSRIALLIAFGLAAVDSFTMPAAVALHAKGNLAALQREIARATQLRFWAALFAVVFLGVVGPHLLGLFGKEFVRGQAVLMMLASAQLVRAGVGPVARLLAVTGHQDRCVYVFGCALVVALILMVSLVPRFGIEGAAASALATIAFWAIWLHVLVVRHVGIRPSVFAIGHAFGTKRA